MEKIYLLEVRNVIKVSKTGKITWSDWTVLSAYHSLEDANNQRDCLLARSEKFVVGLVDYHVRFILVR